MPRFVCAVNIRSSCISGYAIDPGSGRPRALPVDLSGRYLYAADIVGSRIFGFRVDGTNGAQSPVPAPPARADDAPVEVVVVAR